MRSDRHRRDIKYSLEEGNRHECRLQDLEKKLVTVMACLDEQEAINAQFDAVIEEQQVWIAKLQGTGCRCGTG